MAPVTVTVTGLEVPAVAPVGDTELTVGPLMVRGRVLELTWLTESLTLSVALPGMVRRLAGTVAVMEVAELAVMASAVVVPEKVQLATGEVVAKLVPVRVTLKAACPAEAVVWLRLERTGAGPMVKF